MSHFSIRYQIHNCNIKKVYIDTRAQRLPHAYLMLTNYRYLLYVTCKTFTSLVNDPFVQRHEHVCLSCASQLTHPAGLKDLTPCIPALDPDDHPNKPFPLDFYACTPPLLQLLNVIYILSIHEKSLLTRSTWKFVEPHWYSPLKLAIDVKNYSEF